jgi:diguanylate cyclase (GGDEF)-like protein
MRREDAPATTRMCAVLPNWLRAVAALFTLPADDPELAASQLEMLAGQVPVMYVILLSNAFALALTHYRCAPKFLTLAVPGVLFVMACWRLSVWSRWRRHRTDAGTVLPRLRNLIILTAVLSVAFTAWALALFPYGDAYMQCHVEFFMAFTVIFCNSCLVQVRAAALLVSLIVTVPFMIFFIGTGKMVLIFIALNMLLVTIGVVMTMLRSYETFNDLIISKRELIRRQDETQSLSDENLRLANLDALTSLPNRRRFFTELETVIGLAAQNGTRFAVALLDLDRFKTINDMYGHIAGDRLLTEIGLRLKGLAGEHIFIARLGGDEFGAIVSCCRVSCCRRDEELAAFAGTVWHALKRPCVVGDRLASISCSIGVALYPQAGGTAGELFERADYALYHGKQTNKGGMVIFSDEHETSIRQAARVEQAFRLADYEAEMRIMFQPIVDVIASRVVAFEALARWQSPELGMVTPDIFVPVAERTQLIGELTSVLLKKTLHAARNWPPDVSVCFNLSTQNLGSPEMMDVVQRIVQASAVPPQRIEFEVTETALLQDFERAAAAIDKLHELGARVALDDFGTGFSSLGYVHRLHLDKIKIDKSFVSDVVHGRTSPAIIRTIVALCRNLQLACVVEGVETEAQLRAVVMHGCTLVQGYFMSKPVEEAAVTRLIERVASEGRARILAGIETP